MWNQRRPPPPHCPLLMLQLCVVALFLLLVNIIDVTSASECRRAEDCAPANCCGATACLPTASAEKRCGHPSKTCPLDCKPFSLDCGGYCTCTPLGKCAAVLNKVGENKCTNRMKKRGECMV